MNRKSWKVRNDDAIKKNDKISVIDENFMFKISRVIVRHIDKFFLNSFRVVKNLNIFCVTIRFVFICRKMANKTNDTKKTTYSYVLHNS